MQRIVVSGIGVISPVGIGKEEFWKNLIKGKSGIKRITLFDTSRFKRHYGGEIKNFDPEKIIPSSLLSVFPRASCFSIFAVKEALEDAKFEIVRQKAKYSLKNTKKRIAIIIGTTMAEANVLDISSERIIKKRWKEISFNLLLNAFSPSTPRNIGYFFKIEDKNILIPNACAAGNFALGYGYDLLKKGEVDLAIVGGAESLSRVAFFGFQKLYAMAPHLCQPFDKNRKGMILGEGAGILILEREKTALERKASIYAEVLGYGISSDAYHMTIPKKEGIKKAIKKALEDAKISIRDVDYINAHGTGTIQNDKAEAGAIKEVFGSFSKKIRTSSIKSMIGHCMGAASSIEAVACCLAIKEGIIPPTINFKTPDPECDIDCVPNEARKKRLNIALNNGFAFGGNNCCVVFKSYP